MNRKLTQDECRQYFQGYEDMYDVIDRMLKRVEGIEDDTTGIRIANMISPIASQYHESFEPLCETFIEYFENGQEITPEMIAIHDREVRRVMTSIMDVVKNAEALQSVVYGA